MTVADLQNSGGEVCQGASQNIELPKSCIYSGWVERTAYAGGGCNVTPPAPNFPVKIQKMELKRRLFFSSKSIISFEIYSLEFK